MRNCENSTMVHLIVNGKYVKARKSKKSKKVELFLVEEQGNPDSVECFTREQRTGDVTKKQVAFHFTYDSKCYSPKIEGETLTLEDSPRQINGAGSHDWLEMVDIEAGESHQLSTTAGQIGVQLNSEKTFKLIVGGNPVIFEQVCTS